MAAKVTWTSADDTALIAAINRGTGWRKAISDRMGVAESTVWYHAQALLTAGRIDALIYHQSSPRGKKRWRKTRYWTAAELMTLREMVADRRYASEIAHRLNRSVNAIYIKAHEEGIPLGRKHAPHEPPWTAAEDAALRVVWHGNSKPDWEKRRRLAKYLGRSRDALQHRATTLGLKIVHAWTPADDLRLRGALARGATDAEIGRMLGFTTATIGRHRRHLGITPGRWPKPKEESDAEGEILALSGSH